MLKVVKRSHAINVDLPLFLTQILCLPRPPVPPRGLAEDLPEARLSHLARHQAGRQGPLQVDAGF